MLSKTVGEAIHCCYNRVLVNTVKGEYMISGSKLEKIKREKSIKNVKILTGVARHSQHCLFLSANRRRLFSIGYNTYGQTGHDSENFSDVKKMKEVDFFKKLGKRIFKIKASYDSSYVWMDNDDNDVTVYSFGDNQFGQLCLGKKDINNTSIPMKIPFPNEIKGVKLKEVGNGQDHVMFLFEDFSLYVGGYNETGCLGIGTKQNMWSLTKQNHFEKNNIFIDQISLGWTNFSVFLSNERRVYATGNRNAFRADLGKNVTIPIEITELRDKNIVNIECSSNGVCYISENYDFYFTGEMKAMKMGRLKVPTKLNFKKCNFPMNKRFIAYKGNDHKQAFVTTNNELYLAAKSSVQKIDCTLKYPVYKKSIGKQFQKKLRNNQKYLNIKILTMDMY